MRFVIVEDEIRIREGIRKLLQKLDTENSIVGEAENGQEGLELILKTRPDVIITDVRMPQMDGLQMLEHVYQQGLESKAIVISAYSEFSYAKTAIRLGVTEYLVKPSVMSDFSNAVERVKKEISKANQQKPEQIGTLEQMFRDLLNGNLQMDPDVESYLRKRFDVKTHRPIAVCVAYLEEWNEKRCRFFIQEIRHAVGSDVYFCSLLDEKRKEIRMVLYDYPLGLPIKRRIQTYFLGKKDLLDGVSLGLAEVETLGRLQDAYEHLEQYLDWNISMGADVVISYPEIKNVQTELCIYPVELENQLKSAICANDVERVEKYVHQFHRYFQDKKMFEPGKIKECYVRFFWAIINFSKEMGNKGFEDYDHLALLENTMHTKTPMGLTCVTDALLKRLQVEEKTVDNINVKRALSMIHEYYKKGVTLDEIALKLGITPEYLGTQFHQELNITFTAYLKNLRINKAKELLLGTSMKLYEIAVEVGYSDAKYFSKVFRAETGQLPADYRRTH